jgi:hypothetical protein
VSVSITQDRNGDGGLVRAGLALLAVLCGALAGCGTLMAPESREPAPWVEAGSPRPASDTESLLLYYQYVRKLSASELNREHDTVRQSYGRSRTDFNRVRFAMVLSLPSTAFSDEGRALELLEPVAKSGAGQLGGLAYLLSTQIQERRRLDANAQGLQQKLDALRSLERSMIERKR